MPRLTLAACILSLSGIAAFADPPTNQLSLVIFNHTNVDLDIGVGPTTRDFVTVQPGQETRSRLATSQWITFGTVTHTYALPDHVISYAGPATIYLQAESDGNLYFVPLPRAFSTGPPAEQPAGFPLKPIDVENRT
jgi:hypothetical protein